MINDLSDYLGLFVRTRLQICVYLCFYPYFSYVGSHLIMSQSFKYCMLCLCGLVTRLSNAKNGRQELEPQYLVNKKTNSGTWPKGSPAYAVSYSSMLFVIFMSDNSKTCLRVLSTVCYISGVL